MRMVDGGSDGYDGKKEQRSESDRYIIRKHEKSKPVASAIDLGGERRQVRPARSCVPRTRVARMGRTRTGAREAVGEGVAVRVAVTAADGPVGREMQRAQHDFARRRVPSPPCGPSFFVPAASSVGASRPSEQPESPSRAPLASSVEAQPAVGERVRTGEASVTNLTVTSA